MTMDPHLELKRDYFRRLVQHPLSLEGRAELLADLYAPDCKWNGPHPINRLLSRQQILDQLWGPLLVAFPHLSLRLDMLLSGTFAGGEWVASSGFYVGIFEQPWLGLLPTRRPAWLRFGAFERLVDGQIVESFVILDIPALMQQTGQWPLAPSLGSDLIAPPPSTQKGICLDGRDEGESAASLSLVEAMIGGLMQYDGKSLGSMGMRRFWTPDFHWYGPGGIGTMRGHRDYERGHQRPFLRAFPDRRGGDHKCRIADNDLVASTGWPSVRATHSGGGWLGLAPTGRAISMRVMDFWRREGELLAENWVFIDVPELLLQMGLDVFQRAKELQAIPLGE
jgi:predicted ester cyclase